MKMPRDLSGQELAKYLKPYGYIITRQTGCHIRLTTQLQGEHHVTVPNHHPLGADDSPDSYRGARETMRQNTKHRPAQVGGYPILGLARVWEPLFEKTERRQVCGKLC
jgi:predicted RNA binding protein YcfA (HicA-like mRNA interferase family)